MTLPELADALPGAAYAQRRCAALATAGADEVAVAAALVSLLEAAGGEDVGNAARAHLERSGRVPPVGPGDAHGVLGAARLLHERAEADLRAALTRVGLVGPDADELDERRRERADFAARALRERGQAVHAVLDALAAS